MGGKTQGAKLTAALEYNLIRIQCSQQLNSVTTCFCKESPRKKPRALILCFVAGMHAYLLYTLLLSLYISTSIAGAQREAERAGGEDGAGPLYIVPILWHGPNNQVRRGTCE